MHKNLKHFVIPSLSIITLNGILFPCALSLVSCSQTPTSDIESKPTIVSLDQLQAQANTIDSIDQAIILMNQALAMYYNSTLFISDFEDCYAKEYNSESIYQPITMVGESPESWDYSQLQLFYFEPLSDTTIRTSGGETSFQCQKPNDLHSQPEYLTQFRFDFTISGWQPYLVANQDGIVEMEIGIVNYKVWEIDFWTSYVSDNYLTTIHGYIKRDQPDNIDQNKIYPYHDLNLVAPSKYIQLKFPLLHYENQE